MKLGFVGTGNMGSAMARNLLRAGHEVTVYNRSRHKAEALTQDGAKVANSPAEAAHEAHAVFSMLPDDAAVHEAVLGRDGIISGLSKGAAHLGSSTISLNMARRLETEHKSHGQVYVSLPVFGRPESAEAKKLIVVAAGPNEAVERFRPLYEAIGRTTFVVGEEPWRANLSKLAGNFMIAAMLESFGEAFALTEKGGVDRNLFLGIVSELFGSPVYKNYGAIVAEKKFQPVGFALKLGFKDARLVLEAGQELSAPLPLASVIRDRFISAVAHGQQDLDWASISMVSAREANIS